MLHILCIAFILILGVNDINACKGCVGLDEASFDKVIPHFGAVLVKFDVAFPYGDKHEVFSKLATEIVQNQDLLLAEVGVKDYGDKDNEELAKKYGLTKDDFPSVKLFRKGDKTPLTFPSTTDFTVDNLRAFIRDHSNIYLGLPGCLESLDKLANQFVHSEDTNSVLNEAETLSKSFQNHNEQNSAKIYLVIMKKIIENGKKFIKQESDRVSKLLKEKISTKKQTELQMRLNILRAFAVPRKDEL